MATGFGKIFGDAESESDLVPPVDPADIRSVYRMQKEFQALVPNEGLMIHADEYKKACRPGASVGAVFERTSMLGVLQAAEILRPEDAVIDDVVFQVLASIPMKRMKVGVVYDGLPFDTQEFLKEVERLAQSGE